MTDTTYPPLDVPKAGTLDLWIVDSGPMRNGIDPHSCADDHHSTGE